MNELMFNTARELSNEHACGHGDRWGVFADGNETGSRKLLTSIETARLFDTGLMDKAATEALAAAREKEPQSDGRGESGSPVLARTRRLIAKSGRTSPAAWPLYNLSSFGASWLCAGNEWVA